MDRARSARRKIIKACAKKNNQSVRKGILIKRAKKNNQRLG
jgi:hypothetical protein